MCKMLIWPPTVTQKLISYYKAIFNLIFIFIINPLHAEFALKISKYI